MTEPSHSKFSASAASRWLACPGSMVLSAGLPDSSSVYAAWGTVAHSIADCCISDGLDITTADYTLGMSKEQDGHQITVDQDMVDCVNTYLANLREMTAGADILTGEMRVNYADWLGVDRDAAWGTADAIAVAGTELQVHDLKTGMGVEVDAEGNEQMQLYAGGALLEYQDLADIQTVRMVIHQPRIKKAPSEWAISVDELKAWLTGRARSGAISVINAERHDRDAHPSAWDDTYLHPTEKGCRFCKAKATCPALRAELTADTTGIVAATPDEFADLTALPVSEASDQDWIEVLVEKADMFEDMLKAARAELERRLLAGTPSKKFKLVEGKQGNRTWTNEAEAEKLLKSFRLKQEQLYDFSVKSPTQIAKLGPTFNKDGAIVPPKPGEEPPAIGPRQWPKLVALITRAPAKKHVAPLSDKRPALEIRPTADDFETLPADAGDLV